MKIVDTCSIISIYDEMNNPALISKIKQINSDIFITPLVLNELKKEKIKELVNKDIQSKLIQITKSLGSEKLKAFKDANPRLGAGESESLLHIIENKLEKESLFISDDKKARTIAKNYNIKSSWSLGLLELLFSNKIITESEYLKSKENYYKNNPYLVGTNHES